MTEQEFSDLCHALAVELQLPEPESLEEQGEFTVNGYQVGVFLDQESDLIDCYVDLGVIDDGRRAEIFGRLLELNLQLNGMHGESLGYDSESGHLLMRAAIPVRLGIEVGEISRLINEYTSFADDLSGSLLAAPTNASASMLGGMA